MEFWVLLMTWPNILLRPNKMFPQTTVSNFQIDDSLFRQNSKEFLYSFTFHRVHCNHKF